VLSAVDDLYAVKARLQMDVAFTWTDDRSVIDGHAVRYVTDKQLIPARADNPAAIDVCVPTVTESCTDVDAVAGVAGDVNYYEVVNTCLGNEGPS